MKTTIVQAIDFGRAGNAGECLVYGWSVAEQGHTWTDGYRSAICIEAPKSPHGFALEITWSPNAPTAVHRQQIVSILINGRKIATHVVTQPETVAFLCPALLPSERRIIIELDIPTALQPSIAVPGGRERRLLGVRVNRMRILRLHRPCVPALGASSKAALAGSDVSTLCAEIQRHTGMLAHDLFTRFEMVAGNCDMGLALRATGFDRLSLLRFAGASAGIAVRGIETNFEGIGEDLSVFIASNPMKEWMVKDAYGLAYHSGQSSLSMSMEKVLSGQKRHVARLREKFLEDLEIGEKIFVYADQHAVRPLESALPLYFALNRRRPIRMLWVCQGEGSNRGSVDEILPGLARATIDRFAPPLAAGHISVAGWLTVLCNAFLVLRKAKK